MAVFREIAVAGAVLVALLFLSDTMFGGTDDPRFEASLYDSATYAPRSEDVMRNTSPAVRVREVFARFLPGEGQRGRRYSSLTTFIR